MAESSLGHRRVVGKPMPIAFNTSSNAGALLASTNLTDAALVDGLVCHDYIDPDVQMTILATVDETGSAPLEDIVAALAGHPKPAGAALAMVAAGILRIESGIVDASSRLSRALCLEGDHSGETPDGAPQPADGDSTGADRGTGDASTRSRRREISVLTPYTPAIFCVSGLERGDLRNEPLLRRPGIYAAFWGSEVYVGASKNLVARLIKGPHLVAPRPADRIIAIVDRSDQLSWPGAQVAERLLYRQLTASGDLKPRNEEPSGGQVDEVEYKQVHDLVETAKDALHREGLTSAVGALAKVRVGSHTEQALFASKSAMYRLDACGVQARARVDNDSWTLLAGSAIRSDVMPSAHPSARQRRIELLHSGGLVRKGRDYLLTQDLAFGSATGAAHFVVGSKTRADIWSPLNAPSRLAGKH